MPGKAARQQKGLHRKSGNWSRVAKRAMQMSPGTLYTRKRFCHWNVKLRYNMHSQLHIELFPLYFL